MLEQCLCLFISNDPLLKIVKCMVLPIVLNLHLVPDYSQHLRTRGSGRSRPCSPSPQPRLKEKTETASRVFSRVSREKDRELHLPEAICSDNWAQTTSVPAVPAVWVLATLHTCVVVELPCVCSLQGSVRKWSLFAPKLYTYSQAVYWS